MRIFQLAERYRQSVELMEACERVMTTVGEALPEITAYVQARHNRMFQ